MKVSELVYPEEQKANMWSRMLRLFKTKREPDLQLTGYIRKSDNMIVITGIRKKDA